MRSFFLTDRGKVRKHNEDAGGIYYNQSNQVLAIIADGMGGHQSGDVASQMAVAIMKEKWEEVRELSSPSKTDSWLMQTIQDINKTVFERSQVKDELNGMGTTLVAAIISDEFISVAHIGDSRCYIQNQNGFKQITDDHSLVNMLLRTGEISEEDARNHPRKNIVSRALGTEQHVEIDIDCLSVEKTDKFLLCTDGLTDKVKNEELNAYINRNASIEEIAQDLVDLANDRGGEDNISLIIIYPCLSDEVGEETC